MRETGPCPDGCGHRIELDDIDGTHTGFAVALLRARWEDDPDCWKIVTETVPVNELLRSAVELALTLVDRLDMPSQSWFTESAAMYEATGRAVAARLCRDLATGHETPGRLDIHVADLSSSLDVCARLVISTGTSLETLT